MASNHIEAENLHGLRSPSLNSPRRSDGNGAEDHAEMDTSMASIGQERSTASGLVLEDSIAREPPDESRGYVITHHFTSPEVTPLLQSTNIVSPHAYSESAINTRPYGHMFSPESSHHAPSMSTSGATVGTTPLATSLPADPLHGLPEGCTEDAYLRLQEACLMRHFAEDLAHMFDITDRDRHFTLVVPQRAMFSPVLLYAIYTASARHLTRLSHRYGSTEVIEFEGIPLPGLDERTAIRYHNVCISYLIAISNDPTQSYNEDALTAATILRFYEQVDTPLTGWDSETYLNVILTVVNTQQDESFYAVRTIHGPLRDADYYASPACSMRHSACLNALRQEIWSVFLYRRPFRLPLCPSNDYTNLEAGDDFVWTNRILVWTADVLKFCFGTERPSSKNKHQDRFEHWDSLKKFEETWREMRPPSFKPAFFRCADPAEGRIFPEFWHLNDCQLIGLQYYELGLILLAVYDPRLPRVGLGASAIQRNLEKYIRKATLRVCGLALSNSKCSAALVTAAVGVAMFGEYFEDKGEQEALVEMMIKLETEHAWPTQAAVDALREAWSQG